MYLGLKHTPQEKIDRLLRGFKYELPVVRKFLKEGEKVLDFGGGSGEFTALLRLCGYAAYLYEISEVSREEAKNLLGGYSILDSIDGSESLYWIMSLYDAICAFQVLQYIEDREGEIEMLSRLLAPNGFIFVSKTNIKSPWLRVIKEPDFELYDLPVLESMKIVGVFPGPGFLRESDKGLKKMIKLLARGLDLVCERLGWHTSLQEIIVLQKC